jgi:hypothetical protein
VPPVAPPPVEPPIAAEVADRQIADNAPPADAVGLAFTVIVLVTTTGAHPPLVVKVNVIFPVEPFAVYVAFATFVGLFTVPELAVQVPPVAPPPIEPPKTAEVPP